MSRLQTLAGAAVAAIACIALIGAAPASGTGLLKYTTPNPNDTLGIGTEIVASLESGTSMLWKDTGGLANETCTSSEVKFKIEKDTGSGGVNPQGKVLTWTVGGCSHTVDVLAPGSIEIKNIAGTTNGTVISRETRVTTKSTVFGISCVLVTGAGTTLGTLTGAKSSTAHATLDFNAVITKENGCGDATVTGSYVITSPTGLMVEAER